MGEDEKEKGTPKVKPKVGGPGSPQFPPVLFSCLRFLNSADPTISGPGTGYTKVRLKSTETKGFSLPRRFATRFRRFVSSTGNLSQFHLRPKKRTELS